MRSIQLELRPAFDDVVGALHDAQRNLLTARGGCLLTSAGGLRRARGGRLGRRRAQASRQKNRAADAGERCQETAPRSAVGH
jgi:hypothetical protein